MNITEHNTSLAGFFRVLLEIIIWISYTKCFFVVNVNCHSQLFCSTCFFQLLWLHYKLLSKLSVLKNNTEGLGVATHTCNPSYAGGRGKKNLVQGHSQAKTLDLIWKIIKANRTRGLVQVVECFLPSARPWFPTPLSARKKKNPQRKKQAQRDYNLLQVISGWWHPCWEPCLLSGQTAALMAGTGSNGSNSS